MTPNKLFEAALGLSTPWYIEGINFDKENRKLNIKINFKQGSFFDYIDNCGGHAIQKRFLMMAV